MGQEFIYGMQDMTMDSMQDMTMETQEGNNVYWWLRWRWVPGYK